MKLVKILFVVVVFSASLARADTVVVFGDSLSAAYGFNETQGWVHLIKDLAPHHHWINASVSGETTGGGLGRLPRLLEQLEPDWVLIELGGNDGLRGYPLPLLRNNLQAMIALVRESGAKPLLMQIAIPPNYGDRYTQSFTALYQELAKQERVPLLPFMLQEIALNPQLMQADGIHPTAEAQPEIAELIWRNLQPLLNAD